MDILIKNIFEKSCEPINKIERDDVARINRDARLKNVLFGGMYFKLIYEAREKALHQVALALIDAYKQANTFPNDIIINEAKKEVEIVIDKGLVRLKSLTRQSYAQVSSTSKLDNEVV